MLHRVRRSLGAQQIVDARAPDGAHGLSTPREGSRQGACPAAARACGLWDGAAWLPAAPLIPKQRSDRGVGSPLAALAALAAASPPL